MPTRQGFIHRFRARDEFRRLKKRPGSLEGSPFVLSTYDGCLRPRRCLKGLSALPEPPRTLDALPPTGPTGNEKQHPKGGTLFRGPRRRGISVGGSRDGARSVWILRAAGPFARTVVRDRFIEFVGSEVGRFAGEVVVDGGQQDAGIDSRVEMRLRF